MGAMVERCISNAAEKGTMRSKRSWLEIRNGIFNASLKFLIKDWVANVVVCGQDSNELRC